MKRTSFAILIGLFCLFPALFSQVRSEFLLEKNWKFAREDRPEFINPTFNVVSGNRDRSAWLGDLRPFQLSE